MNKAQEYLERLPDLWDAELWAARSRKGEVCGIYGCSSKPIVKCEHCLNMYCHEHKFVLDMPGHIIKGKLGKHSPENKKKK